MATAKFSLVVSNYQRSGLRHKAEQRIQRCDCQGHELEGRETDAEKVTQLVRLLKKNHQQSSSIVLSGNCTVLL